MQVGNNSFVEVLEMKLKKSINTNTSYVGLVVGPSQGGKTMICSDVFKRLGFDVVKINDIEITNIKDLAKALESHRDTFTISSFFSSKPKMLFLDDFDVICSSGGDKAMLTYICNYIKHPNFSSAPVRMIVTISNTSEKTFGVMTKKVDDVLRIHNPTPDVAYTYLTERGFNVTMEMCYQMQGNIGGILGHVKLASEDDANITIKDKSQQDILEMVCKKDPRVTPEVLLMYDARIMAMTYFDNIKKMHVDPLQKKRKATALLSELHIFDERMYNNETGSAMAVDLWCYGLLHLSNDKPSKGMAYPLSPTKILSRTSARYLLNKRIHNFLSNNGIDQDSREAVFDAMSNRVLTKGKAGVDKEAFMLCREYMQTIGGINKDYIDKLDI